MHLCKLAHGLLNGALGVNKLPKDKDEDGLVLCYLRQHKYALGLLHE